MALVRFVGMRKLLCNNCGYVFTRFDPLGKLKRYPTKREAHWVNRRRGPRFPAHLPTAISLIHGESKEGKATYSEPSHGHCESINKAGMGLSLVGSRFPENELSRLGRLLLIRVHLPEGKIEAVVSIVNHRRVGGNQQRKWFLGVQIRQISDADKASLQAYLEKRTVAEPLNISA